MHVFPRSAIGSHCVGAQWPDFLGSVRLGESFVIEIERSKPVNGPVRIEGVKAGDAIAIQIEEIEMVGEFWSRSTFRADLGGFTLEGSATVGFDPGKGKWVSTWIDNGMPFLFYFEGDLDEEAGTLTMTGSGPSPVDGEITTYRTVESVVGPDERTLDMFVTLPTGDEMQMFTYTYTRVE